MNDFEFMGLALEQARAAFDKGDVPVGAVAVHGKTVLAAAHNLRESNSDPTAHAEMLVLREAALKLNSWRLEEVTVFVTLEPCPMCAGALVAARVPRVVYGAADERAGAALSIYNIVQDPRLNHQCALEVGVRADDAAELLTRFFRKKRGRAPSL